MDLVGQRDHGCSTREVPCPHSSFLDAAGRRRSPATDGFDGFQTCTWVPNDINAPSYSTPTIDDQCLSQGGLDQNIYVATMP